MPRTGRGGMRPGNPGTPYPNRSDLGQQPSLPARVATDQTYGKAQQQLQAQRTVPMAPPSPPGPPPAPQAGPGGAPTPVQASPIPPGAFGDLHRPTERPFEPVTSGIPSGPGPGPEALPQQPATKVSDVLSQAARSIGSTTLANLAARAASAGQ